MLKKLVLFYIIFALISLAFYVNSVCGECKGAWFSVGVGRSLAYKNSFKPFNFLSGFAQFSTIKKNNIFSIYINKIGRINTVKHVYYKTSDELDNSSNFGLMLGKTKIKRFGYFYASIGLSYTQGTRKKFSTNPNSSRKKNYKTIGIPFEIQLGTTIKFLGLGIKLFTNLNLESSYTCFLLTLNYGKLLKN